jgi:SAM-dependent methyltransferase
MLWMKKIIWPPFLYSFLKLIEASPLEKKILDCGAGGPQPPLALFHSHGFDTYGIDILKSQIEKAEEFCKENNIKIDFREGDMRSIPFEEESFSHIFTQHSICHLSKDDTRNTIDEIYRVLRKGGYCFVDFASVDCSYFGAPTLGEEVQKGEFQYTDSDGDLVLHSFYEDNEPDIFFDEFEIIRKDKIFSEYRTGPGPRTDVHLHYYLKKPE